ncbi:MAG: lysophospholipid acyltransferase family protein [Puniceicoccaceae bacterium]|nr:MAG: lysophospholipid acyltransferase family protein [Puniceicoccaceae bacterium]
MCEPKLIDLKRALGADAAWVKILRPGLPLLERLMGIRGVNQIYAAVHAQLEDTEDDPAFFMKTLRVMGVHFELDNADFERIPKTGPLIVVANHPFGGVDGVVLGALLKGLRTDAKLMGNYLLANMEGIRGGIVEVNPFGNEDAARANLNGMRQAIRLLREGGCLGAFPAGEVSSLHLRSRAVVDPPWTTHMVNLAIKTEAQVLPVYFQGRNSAFFQLAGLLHPRVRTALLGREFSRARGRAIKIKVGALIDPKRLAEFENKAAATEYLRLKTYALKDQRPKSQRKRLRLPFRSASSAQTLQALAPAQPAARLMREIEQLPAALRLVEHGDFEVYCAPASQIPSVLKEIGRLREETFRAVQEGTGQATDLDEFDAYYLHLFMWNRAESEIVGAYRIGLADEIVKAYGKQGLYTSTLFRYRSKFLEKLGPAIELGRSFISIKYQKKHASLALIWRGIGEYVARHPQYRTLFGPVSITDAYNNISKDLMVHFFREHNFDEEMARHVKPRKPPKSFKMLKGVSLKNIGEAIRSVDSVSAIVSGFEDDKKGVPILLRHYLKLNGVLLSFNVDPAFSDVIDGLILVDLCKTDPKILQRYLGKEGYADFMDYHAQSNASASHAPNDLSA